MCYTRVLANGFKLSHCCVMSIRVVFFLHRYVWIITCSPVMHKDSIKMDNYGIGCHVYSIARLYKSHYTDLTISSLMAQQSAFDSLYPSAIFSHIIHNKTITFHHGRVGISVRD